MPVLNNKRKFVFVFLVWTYGCLILNFLSLSPNKFYSPRVWIMTSVSFVSYIVALMKIMIHSQSSLELLNVNFKLYFNHNTYILYNI